jgi:formylglycine-generating enzyme required for sulfatase activity
MPSLKSWGLAALTLSSVAAYAAEGKGQPGGEPASQSREPPTGLEMVFVRGGCFQMGDLYDDASESTGEGPAEKPVHEVCVDDFSIGKYEVTRGLWKAIVGDDPSSEAMCREASCPVDGVDFGDIEYFLSRLNAREGGSKYRLPTEAEWEYAARSGGKLQRYAGGNDLDSVSWYIGTTRYRTDPTAETRPVGEKAPNGLGLYDMSGNVYEITSDWYDEGYYAKSPRDNPRGPASGEAHVKKGGCANGDPRNSRVARRSDFTTGGALAGFRLARAK